MYIAGVVVQIGPDGVYGAFLAGRFIAGAAVGALSALVPLYQGESQFKLVKELDFWLIHLFFLTSFTQIAPRWIHQSLPAHDYARYA